MEHHFFLWGFTNILVYFKQYKNTTQHGAPHPHTDHILRCKSVISLWLLLVMVKYMKNARQYTVEIQSNKDIFIQRGTYALVLNKHIIPTLRSYFLNNCSYVFDENYPATIKPHISSINQSSVMSKIICLTQTLLGWIGPFLPRLNKSYNTSVE